MAQIITTTYASTTDTTALSITLNSLASDTTLQTGRASAVVDNITPLYVDAILTGQIRLGTSPTANRSIEIWLYTYNRLVSSTFTYPDGNGTEMPGTDAAVTFGSGGTQKQQLTLAWAMTNSNVSNQKRNVGPVSVAGAFGGVLPLKWGVFVTHSTGVALNSADNYLHYLGIKYTST